MDSAERLFEPNALMDDDMWPRDIRFEKRGRPWVSTTFQDLPNHVNFPQLQGHDVNLVAVDLTCGPYSLHCSNSLATHMGEILIRTQNLNFNRLDSKQYLSNFPATCEVQYCNIVPPNDFQPTDSQPHWSPDWWNESSYGRFYNITFLR